MNIINLLKILYYKNKFLLIVVVIAVILISGCTNSSGAPQGPIGGGCG